MTKRNIAELRHVVVHLRDAIGPARGQRALDLLARLAADAPTAILLADNHGRYVWANAAASELLGYSKAALLRLFVWDITPADSESDVDVLWRMFLHGSYQCGTYPIRRRSGRRRWFTISLSHGCSLGFT